MGEGENSQSKIQNPKSEILQPLAFIQSAKRDRSHTQMLIVSENPEIEIDLIYQLLRMAVIPAQKELQGKDCFHTQEVTLSGMQIWFTQRSSRNTG